MSHDVRRPHRPTALLFTVATAAALVLSAARSAPGVAQPAPSPSPAHGSGDSSAPQAAPADRRVASLLAAVRRRGRDATAVLPMLELWRGFDSFSRGQVGRALQALTGDRALSPAARAYANVLLARTRLREGDAAAARQAFASLGYLSAWSVLGPFDNEGKRGFDAEQPPETAALLSSPRQADARYAGRERDVSWRTFPDVARYGYVSFDAVFRPDENVCGFAETYVNVPRAQPIQLWAGGGGALKVYLNGALVLRDAAYRQPDPDRLAVQTQARAGWNRIVVKACVTDTTWGFYLRLADARGEPLAGARVSSDPPPDFVPPPATSSRPSATALPTALSILERNAASEHAAPSAVFELARFLAWTGADDPAERRARQLAARAADAEPTVEHLSLAANLADERAELVRFASRAGEVAPNDPQSLLLRANVTRSGFTPEAALPLLDRIPESSEYATDAAVVRAQILRELSLPELALTALEQASRRSAATPGLLRARVDAADAASRRNVAVSAREELLAIRWDDLPAHRATLSDALERGDRERAQREIAALRDIVPDNARILVTTAEAYDALGDREQAIAAYREASQLAPEDATVLVALGRILLQANQNGPALDALRAALALRPQDADTRELVEQIGPLERRPDERFAAASEDVLARRRNENRFPISVLQDLTVNTVFENGLGSSFRQIAVEVNDVEGARRWRAYPIQFDPASQRVDIRLARVYRGDRALEALQTYEQALGEPWYRMYYDTRALVVVFPDLEPGDVVELRYRLDDTAHRNLFADYYGDLHPLARSEPIANMEYVLITPATRQFYFHVPTMPGLRRTTTTEQNQRIDRFVATDVAALRNENGMPGITEVAPYLHVSTYQSWQDVGHWYWGLIRDQLYADESLRTTVARLVRGAPDTREKVRRIHEWVVHNTRYVALEFGIHGYLPYRVPQIVQRGFGDCKDKASLLFTMLREAGVEARFVLLRTRRNGAIDDLPASLAVFDHAIAYVPELDLFLDGTAEHSGIDELPNMDQGATVLVVGPDGAELRHAPVLPAERNLRTRSFEVQLSADGSATLAGEETVAGGDAQQLRSYYQAEGTRRDRLERTLGTLFPGISLASQEMSPLDDLDHPVRVSYRARAPQLGRRDGDDLLVAPSVIDNLTRVLATTPTRVYPLDLGTTSSYRETRVLRPSDGLRLERVPSDVEVDSPFGRLTIHYAREVDAVRITTELVIRVDRVTAAEYPRFRAFTTEADEKLRERVVFRGGAR